MQSTKKIITNKSNKKMINSSSSNHIIKRWDALYNIDKVYRTKLEHKKEIQKQLDLNKELKGCTFVPKLTGRPQYLVKKAIDTKKSNLKTCHTSRSKKDEDKDVLIRQVNFIQKKKENLEDLKNQEILREKIECSFSPHIRKKVNLDKVFNVPVEDCVIDSNAYNEYVTRCKKKREDNEKQCIISEKQDIIKNRGKLVMTNFKKIKNVTIKKVNTNRCKSTKKFISKKVEYKKYANNPSVSVSSIEKKFDSELIDMNVYYAKNKTNLKKDISMAEYKKAIIFLRKELKGIKLKIDDDKIIKNENMDGYKNYNSENKENNVINNDNLNSKNNNLND